MHSETTCILFAYFHFGASRDSGQTYLDSDSTPCMSLQCAEPFIWVIKNYVSFPAQLPPMSSVQKYTSTYSQQSETKITHEVKLLVEH